MSLHLSDWRSAFLYACPSQTARAAEGSGQADASVIPPDRPASNIPIHVPRPARVNLRDQRGAPGGAERLARRAPITAERIGRAAPVIAGYHRVDLTHQYLSEAPLELDEKEQIVPSGRRCQPGSCAMIARITWCRDGAAMWDTTVRVERELPVDAAPDEVWALARSPAALSAMPARFAFSVPDEVAGADRLCCLLVGGKIVACAVLDVRQEIAGQMICWQTRSTKPAGKQVFMIGVLPRPRGSMVRLSVSTVVPRPNASSYEAYWRTEVRAWADSLREIAEGRAAWPRPEMPANMREKCSAPRRLKKPVQVSAATVVHAPAAAVWEAVWAPESSRLMNPAHVACAGHVPGTPERRAGEMQYYIHRRPDERFTAQVSVVTELVEGVSAVAQSLAPPHAEVCHLVTPVADGTRLELACRWPARVDKTAGKNMAAGVARGLQEMVEGYKALIEEPA